MYIDTHCHLNFPQYDADRAMVVGNAKKAGVKQFINPGVDLFSSSQAIALAQKHPSVIYAAVGIHPYEAQHDPDVSALYKLYNDYKRYIIAIGECGLDYHQYKGEAALGKKDKQKRLFAEQVELALKHNLPVIFHCRGGTSNVSAASDAARAASDAARAAFDRGGFDDFFDVLDSLPEQPRGVIHCFSGGLQEVREAKHRGLFIGIDGNVTYSKHLQMIIPQIPLSMILLETDAPYLTPIPHRGTRNEPKYISLIAREIAKLLVLPVKEIEETTTISTRRLFNIS